MITCVMYLGTYYTVGTSVRQVLILPIQMFINDKKVIYVQLCVSSLYYDNDVII